MSASDGAAFVFSATENVPAVWGTGERVLWSQGEPLMLVGPDGVGKTTLAQQLVLHRCGVLDGPLLGLPVVPDERRVLYVAADRPRQAARSMRRMVSGSDRGKLAERLVVWKGPLLFDLAKEPEALAAFVTEHDAGTVVVDSLKDVVLDLVGDEAGSRAARAVQHVVAAGIEVLVLHHQRKEQGGQVKTIESVYGSRWLTSVCGSVVMLWGDPGDDVVKLRHLKQPGSVVGPLTVVHDHARGRSTLSEPEQAPVGPTLYERVIAWVNDNPTGEPTKAVQAAVEGRDKDIADALKLGATNGDLRSERGPRGAHLWYPAATSARPLGIAGQTSADLAQAPLPDTSARPAYRSGRPRSEGTSAQTPADVGQTSLPLPGDDGYLDYVFTAFQNGHVSEGEWRQADLAHRHVRQR